MIQWKTFRITKVEAESTGAGEMRTFDININIADVQKKNGELEIDFTYRVDYGKEIGFLNFTGFVVIGGKVDELSDIHDSWQKKTLPNEFSSQFTNVIAFNCEVNGVLITRALNLPAPIIPPQIAVKK